MDKNVMNSHGFMTRIHTLNLRMFDLSVSHLGDLDEQIDNEFT